MNGAAVSAWTIRTHVTEPDPRSRRRPNGTRFLEREVSHHTVGEPESPIVGARRPGLTDEALAFVEDAFDALASAVVGVLGTREDVDRHAEIEIVLYLNLKHRPLDHHAFVIIRWLSGEGTPRAAEWVYQPGDPYGRDAQSRIPVVRTTPTGVRMVAGLDASHNQVEGSESPAGLALSAVVTPRLEAIIERLHGEPDEDA